MSTVTTWGFPAYPWCNHRLKRCCGLFKPYAPIFNIILEQTGEPLLPVVAFPFTSLILCKGLGAATCGSRYHTARDTVVPPVLPEGADCGEMSRYASENAAYWLDRVDRQGIATDSFRPSDDAQGIMLYSGLMIF